MAVTDATGQLADIFPISVRLPLLRTWVRVKHWMNSPVGKTFGTPDEVLNLVLVYLHFAIFMCESIKKNSECFIVFVISTLKTILCSDNTFDQWSPKDVNRFI